MKNDPIETFHNLVAQNPAAEFTVEEDPSENDEQPSICVVRLRTVSWKTNRGLYQTKQITFMRRLSSGYQILEEDASNIGVQEVIDMIENLNECDDGIYEVGTCNQRYDWESGYLDDYDYVLHKIEFAGPPLWMFEREQRRNRK